MSIQLPVFRVTRRDVSHERLGVLAAELFGVRGDIAESDGRLVVTAGSRTVELFTASGGLFAADASELHNPGLAPALPGPERASELARELIDRHRLFPRLADGLEVTELPCGATYVASRPRHGAQRRNVRQLDVQARFALSIRIPGMDGSPDLLPVIGGGGKLTFTFGNEARLIAVHGGFRHISDPTLVQALDQKEAFEQLGAEGEFDPAEAYLAYYHAPDDVEQQFLSPVWVFRSRFEVDHADGRASSMVPSRHAFVAATADGPTFRGLEPQPERQEKPPLAASPPARAINPSEVGTSWIKQIDQRLPLNGSPRNAQGFVDGLSAGGWQVNFNWGDLNAWESDWDSEDDTWVDAADFVFYTGHANQNGWVLCVPGKKQSVLLTPSEVGSRPQTPGDRYGQNDLEWVAVAACGPLQDDLLSPGGGDVLARWDGAFDGLHTLLGYGAVTFDNTDEGRKLARYTRSGMTVIDAWFRTAKEVQPATNGESAPDGPDVWVGAMWVTKRGTDPFNDHIWGHGPVAADPTSPTTLVCMWTTC